MKENDSNRTNRKIILLRAGLTAAGIARSIGVTPQAVHNEIVRPGASRKVREALCAATKTTPAEFWPDFPGEQTDVSEAAQA